MTRGLRLEPKVLQRVSETLNVEILQSGLTLHPKYPIFGASADGISKDYVFEVKSPTSEKNMLSYIGKNGKPSNKCKAQVHLQMLLCNRREGILCVAHPDFEQTGNVKIVRIKFEEKYIESLLKRAQQFWIKYVYPKLVTPVIGELPDELPIE